MKLNKGFVFALAAMLLLSVSAIAQRGSQEYITREARHELVMLPTYNVFDNLAYKVDGNTITLYGQVVHGELKSEAEAVVKKIEGVERVDNQIEILPPSSMDDRIRIAEYRAIYGQDGFLKYAIQSVPPVHIIVKNGRVTLAGVVDSQGDKDLANIRANGVSGVFQVTNDLQVAGNTRSKK